MLTPEQAAEKWRSNMGRSGDAMRQGVSNVTESPMQAAKRSKQKMADNFNAAMSSGKWERGLDRVSLEDWKTAMTGKGAQRISQGADAGKQKMLAFQQQWIPYVQNVQARIKQMPNTGIEDALARVRAMMEAAKRFQRT